MELIIIQGDNEIRLIPGKSIGFYFVDSDGDINEAGHIGFKRIDEIFRKLGRDMDAGWEQAHQLELESKSQKH